MVKPNKLIQSTMEGASPKDFYENQLPIHKENDIALIFMVGGPILNTDWFEQDKNFGFLFGKKPYSKNLDRFSTDDFGAVNFNVPVDADLFFISQPQWEEVDINSFYEIPLKITGITGWSEKNFFKLANKKDKNFLENFDEKHWVTQALNLICTTSKWINESVDKLKELGYKEIHIIGHSYSTFTLLNYITLYKDDGLKDIDSISCVASRIHLTKSESLIDPIKDGIPGFVYNPKDKKYSIIKTMPILPIFRNAVSYSTILSVFKLLLRNSDEFLNFNVFTKLKPENKAKITLYSNDWDDRVGRLHDVEKEKMKNAGIKYVVIDNEKINKYRYHYLRTQKNPEPYKPKTSILGSGISNHELLLIYLTHNFKELYSTQTKPKIFTRNDDSILCNIKTKGNFNCKKM